MRKIILSCCIFMILNISAKEWESHWITALEDCYNEDYSSAEHNFAVCVDLMETESNLDHPSIYVDRARLYLILNQYENALKDINKALFSDKLKNSERVKAVIARMTAKIHLGFTSGYQEDIEFLINNFQVQVENTENHLIIRNIPLCQAFRKSMSNFFIHSGICYSEEDIKIHSPDIWIVNKVPQFEKTDHSSDYKPCINKQVRTDIRIIEECKRFCDANTEAAIAWCINFPELCRVHACQSAVFEIQNNCHACCQNNNPQDFCVIPFGDIVDVMQKYLLNPCGCQ